MTTAEDIRKAVEQLDESQLAWFRAWFDTFDAGRFDDAIARDAAAGKPDGLADEALAKDRAAQSLDL